MASITPTMESAWYIYVLAVMAGAVAGAINTLAGSGSLITLPVLIFLGLPANVANGTNRVGITIQNIAGLSTLKRGGALELEGSVWYLVPAVIGAVIGAFVAVDIDAETMKYVIGTIMAAMLVVVVLNPKQWIGSAASEEGERERPPWWLILAFVAIGAYGGFIQAGVGILLLVGLVTGAGFNPVTANGIKLFLALIFTFAALVVFATNDQVDWWLGVMMGSGQALGAWVAARFAVQREDAGKWIRRLLIAVVAVSLTKLFGLWDLILGG